MTTATRENRALDFWVERYWPDIRRKLMLQAGIPPEQLAFLQAGVAPEWTEPGRAIFWQKTFTHSVSVKPDGNRVVEDTHTGWQRTNSVAAGTESLIADYLRRGFLLRSPAQAVEAVAAESSAAPVAAVAQTYRCTRHGPDKVFAFPNWKAYLVHCKHHKELPESEQAPADALRRAAQFPWYCFIHDTGFATERGALHHYRDSLRSFGPTHPTVQQMETRMKPPVSKKE